MERLPEATVISVSRPELEAFHTRKLVLEYRADGARLVSDEPLKKNLRSLRALAVEATDPQEIVPEVTPSPLVVSLPWRVVLACTLGT